MLKVNVGDEPPIVCTILMKRLLESLLIASVCIEAEPVIDSDPTNSDEVDFSQMTKSQIETYGRKLGIELDRRKNKTDLIAKLEEFISKQEES